MLNWIDKNERLPTKADLSEAGYLYGVTASGVVTLVYFDHLKTVITSFTHWLPFREMPIPKRWRTPTIQDLAKAGKPIPCRIRNSEDEPWFDTELIAINMRENAKNKFLAAGDWFMFCEICDD